MYNQEGMWPGQSSGQVNVRSSDTYNWYQVGSLDADVQEIGKALWTSVFGQVKKR